MAVESGAEKTILLVDDEEGFTRLLKLNLERDGRYTVYCENDSLEVLNTARRLRPDIILLDVVMPGVEGGDLAKQIKADDELKHTPVIMLTATVDNRDTGGDAQITESGQVLIGKPVNLDSLYRWIEELCGGENHSREQRSEVSPG